jgi:hypothetical protein
MNQTKTIDFGKFIKDEFLELNKQEDFAIQLGKKDTDPKTAKVVKMLLENIEGKRAALREILFMLYKEINKNFPHVKINDNYDLFENFTFTLEVKKLDMPLMDFSKPIHP